MAHHRPLSALAAAAVLAALGILSACAGEPASGPASGSQTSGSPTQAPSASSSPTPTIDPVAIPTDCLAILTPDVLSQLEGTPLNDPATGVQGGPQPDGSLICHWGSAGAAEYLTTTISSISRGPALDQLNALADAQGYTCYTPDDGVRCEKTWFSEPDLLPQGQTLFWREDILIDTQFTVLAPSGYTAAVVSQIFGAGD